MGGLTGRRWRWTPARVRALAAALIGFQIVHGARSISSHVDRSFTDSYFLITYQHGFVRRGLAGEILHLLFGVPTQFELDALTDVMIGTVCIAFLWLVERLIRHATRRSWTMAILVAASPFTFEFFPVNQRPDLLGVTLLIVVGMAVVRSRRLKDLTVVAISVGFGLLILVHEDAALVQFPWAVALVAISQGSWTPGRDTRKLLMLFGPPVAAGLAVSSFGIPNQAKVAALRADVARFPLQGRTNFTFLADSFHDALHLVSQMPASVKVDSLVVGGVLLLVQVTAVAVLVRPTIWSSFAVGPRRRVGVAVGIVILIATVLLFATGKDWLRWVAECGSCWLVFESFGVLLSDGRDWVEETPPSLSPWVLLIAVYLVAVPPLPYDVLSGGVGHYLLPI